MCISLFGEHSGRNDMDTIEYATFCYGSVEVENGLNYMFDVLGWWNP